MSNQEFYKKFESFSVPLTSFAVSLTKNKEEARDLYQETAFRALANKEKYRQDKNFKAWLFTIMRNIFINNYRRKAKSNTFIDTTENEYFLNSTITHDNRAEGNILLDDLNGMIKQLHDNIREPFEMHLQGFKYHEIADTFQIPLGTVKSRIFFARKELQQRIRVKYANQFS